MAVSPHYNFCAQWLYDINSFLWFCGTDKDVTSWYFSFVGLLLLLLPIQLSASVQSTHFCCYHRVHSQQGSLLRCRSVTFLQGWRQTNSIKVTTVQSQSKSFHHSLLQPLLILLSSATSDNKRHQAKDCLRENYHISHESYTTWKV